jgi:hypothetical protein
MHYVVKMKNFLLLQQAMHSPSLGSLLRLNIHFVFLMCVVYVRYCVCNFMCFVLFCVMCLFVLF